MNLSVAFFYSFAWQLILRWTRCDRLIIQSPSRSKYSSEVVVARRRYKVDVFISLSVVYFKLGNRRLISLAQKNVTVIKHFSDYSLRHLLALHHFPLNEKRMKKIAILMRFFSSLSEWWSKLHQNVRCRTIFSPLKKVTTAYGNICS